MSLLAVVIVVMLVRLAEVVIRATVPAFFRSEEEAISADLVRVTTDSLKSLGELVGLLTERVEAFERIVAAQREAIDLLNERLQIADEIKQSCDRIIAAQDAALARYDEITLKLKDEINLADARIKLLKGGA